jgi:hypothetical protein
MEQTLYNIPCAPIEVVSGVYVSYNHIEIMMNKICFLVLVTFMVSVVVYMDLTPMISLMYFESSPLMRQLHQVIVKNIW